MIYNKMHNQYGNDYYFQNCLHIEPEFEPS